MTSYLINGNKVDIKKIHRTRTQFEWHLKIFMGNSSYESILIYQEIWLTKKNALNAAKKAIFNSKKPRIEKQYY